MARAFKNNAVGIDEVINNVNKDIYTSLTELAGWTNYEAYHRANKNYTREGIIPEIYVQHSGDTGEYLETLFEDRYNATSFFTVEDNSDISELGTYNVSLFMQLDLRRLYPNLLHRADEEAHNDVIVALRDHADVKITNIIKRIDNVYSEFRTDNLNYDDLSERHVFRVDFTIDAIYCCSYLKENPSLETEEIGGFTYIN